MRKRALPGESEGTASVPDAERPRWPLGPAVALAALALLAALGDGSAALRVDVAVSTWLQTAVPESVAHPVTAVLVLGASAVSLPLVGGIAVVLFRRGNRLGALALALILVGVAVEFVLKSRLDHPMVWAEFHRDSRYYPFPEISASALGLRHPFPSGHMLRTTFLALTAANLAARVRPALARAARLLAWLVVVCAAFSVIYLGWHWATDALGGIALGYALAALAAYLPRLGWPPVRRAGRQ